jgi:hypothetical protein
MINVPQLSHLKRLVVSHRSVIEASLDGEDYLAIQD